MTPQDFCFWLHGFFELTGRDDITPEQAKMIREHLDLVFTKVTPPLEKPTQKDGLERMMQILREGNERNRDTTAPVIPWRIPVTPGRWHFENGPRCCSATFC